MNDDGPQTVLVTAIVEGGSIKYVRLTHPVTKAEMRLTPIQARGLWCELDQLRMGTLIALPLGS